MIPVCGHRHWQDNLHLSAYRVSGILTWPTDWLGSRAREARRARATVVPTRLLTALYRKPPIIDVDTNDKEVINGDCCLLAWRITRDSLPRRFGCGVWGNGDV